MHPPFFSSWLTEISRQKIAAAANSHSCIPCLPQVRWNCTKGVYSLRSLTLRLGAHSFVCHRTATDKPFNFQRQNFTCFSERDLKFWKDETYFWKYLCNDQIQEDDFHKGHFVTLQLAASLLLLLGHYRCLQYSFVACIYCISQSNRLPPGGEEKFTILSNK